MAQAVREVMTAKPVVLPAATTVEEAARKMRDLNLGNVLVLEDDKVCGIVTDRDIVVRAVAEGSNLQEKTLGDICSKDLATVSADEGVDAVLSLMREKALRRVPVMKNGSAVGIVSIGDLAVARDKGSVLASISASPPTR